jgi:hypothetical protein
MRKSTPLRGEKRLRPVVPMARNRVGPLPRNRVVPFKRNQGGPITRNPAHIGHQWWAVQEIVCSDQRFYPRHLPTLLRPFLAGDEIAEPLERWP